MKEFPCIEYTLDLEINDFIIRVWVDSDELNENFKLEGLEKYIFNFYHSSAMTGVESLVRYIAKIKRVNAVQVKSQSYGVVVYTVDFNDTHG